MTKIDIGKTYGSLTVVSQSPEQKRSKQCECFCLCGNKVIMYTYNLMRFKHKTCFCAQREKIRSRKRRIYLKSERKCKPEYAIWKGIRKRCFNKNCKSYSITENEGYPFVQNGLISSSFTGIWVRGRQKLTLLNVLITTEITAKKTASGAHTSNKRPIREGTTIFSLMEKPSISLNGREQLVSQRIALSAD